MNVDNFIEGSYKRHTNHPDTVITSSSFIITMFILIIYYKMFRMIRVS